MNNLDELLKKYVKILNVQNWDIQLLEDESLEVSANCYMIFNDYKAVIKLKKQHSLEEKEKSLIHELIHLVRRDEYDLCTEIIQDEYLNKLYARFHERSVEQLANVIYNLAKGV